MEKRHLRKGCIIVLEGNEAAGKTTQAKRLTEYMNDMCQIDTVYIREPGGNPLAEQLREIILNNEIDTLGELFLFNAVRAINVNENVIPALKEGKLIIMDRFIDSTYVYQGFLNGNNLTNIETLNNMIFKDTGLSEYYCHRILIDVELKETMKRLGGRGEGNKYDRLDENFLRRVGTAYRIRFDDLADHLADVETIDGNGNEDEVFDILVNRTMSYIEQRKLL